MSKKKKRQERVPFAVIANVVLEDGRTFIGQIDVDAVHDEHARSEAVHLARKQLAAHEMPLKSIKIKDVLWMDDDWQLYDLNDNEVNPEFNLWVDAENVLEIDVTLKDYKATSTKDLVPFKEDKPKQEAKPAATTTTTKTYKKFDDPLETMLSAIARHGLVTEYDAFNQPKPKEASS